MEGSVLIFLKAEWKVSDTGSAQCWASSSFMYSSKANDINCDYILHVVFSPSFQKGHGNLLWKRAHEARESQLLGHIKRANIFCKGTYKYMLYIFFKTIQQNTQ